MKENFRTEPELHEKPPHSGHRDRFIKKLEQQSKSKVLSIKPRFFRMGIAAAFAAALGFLVLLNPFSNNEQIIEENRPLVSPKLELAVQSNQLDAIYTEHVAPQILKLRRHLPELETQIKLLEILESEYVKLKDLHSTSGGNPVVTQEMIRNHQLRHELMEEVLKQIALDRNLKSKNDEIENI